MSRGTIYEIDTSNKACSVQGSQRMGSVLISSSSLRCLCVSASLRLDSLETC